MMKSLSVSELIDYVDSQDGDLTIVRLDDNSNQVELLGVCASSDDIQDFNLPKGKYLVLRAIQTIEI